MIKLLLLALMAAPLLAQAGARVDCHTEYLGERRLISAGPTAEPYAVAPVAIDRDFLFRVALREWPADEAGVTVAVYFPGADGPVMIQQAHYPWPPARGGRHGFTGLQQVFEPTTDGELSYWCETVRSRTKEASR